MKTYFEKITIGILLLGFTLTTYAGVPVPPARSYDSNLISVSTGGLGTFIIAVSQPNAAPILLKLRGNTPLPDGTIWLTNDSLHYQRYLNGTNAELKYIWGVILAGRQDNKLVVIDTNETDPQKAVYLAE